MGLAERESPAAVAGFVGAVLLSGVLAASVLATLAAALLPGSPPDLLWSAISLPVVLAFPAFAVFVVLIAVGIATKRTFGVSWRGLAWWQLGALAVTVGFAVLALSAGAPDGTASVRDGQETITYDRGSRVQVVGSVEFSAHRRRETRFMVGFFMLFAVPPAALAFAAAGSSRPPTAGSPDEPG